MSDGGCLVVVANVMFFPPSRGGRQTMPEGDGYSPYFRSGSMSESLAVRVLGMPDDARFDSAIIIRIELIYHPSLKYGALKVGERFFLSEGAKTIAEGVLVSVAND